MTDTYLSVLQRWGVDLEAKDLTIPCKALRTAKPVRPFLCSHAGKSVHDYSTVRATGSGGQLYDVGEYFKQHSKQLSKKPGLQASTANEILNLVLLGEFLKFFEMSTLFQIDTLIGLEAMLLGVSDEVAAEFSDWDPTHHNRTSIFFTPLVRGVASRRGLEIDLALASYTEKVWDSYASILKAEACSKFGLPLLTEDRPSAYFEATIFDESALNFLKRVYPWFQSVRENNEVTHVFEIPTRFIASMEEEIILQDIGSTDTFQRCWERVEEGKFFTQRPPSFSRIYKKPSEDPEFTEILKVLAKEMTFKEALKSAAALSESS